MSFMIKQKIFDKVKGVLSEFLYGFDENSFDVGIFSGTLELKNLIVKPQVVNAKLQKSNSPILLKAGMISHLKIRVSLFESRIMNLKGT